MTRDFSLANFFFSIQKFNIRKIRIRKYSISNILKPDPKPENFAKSGNSQSGIRLRVHLWYRTLFAQYTQRKFSDLLTNNSRDFEVEYFCDIIIYHYQTFVLVKFFCKYNAQNLEWNWYGSIKDCLPFHSGIFHNPYRNSRFIPYHALAPSKYCRETTKMSQVPGKNTFTTVVNSTYHAFTYCACTVPPRYYPYTHQPWYDMLWRHKISKNTALWRVYTIGLRVKLPLAHTVYHSWCHSESFTLFFLMLNVKQERCEC